ncbi:hypothetical protein MBANPS3_006709 [Mucor bainieri]
MIRKVSNTSLFLACCALWMTAQAQEPMAAPNTNMASVFQNMINYFNEHPFTDATGQPSQAFQSMLHQMQSTEASNANPATNSAANVALPATPPNVANIGLPAAAAAAPNVNAAIKSTPADIPIALAAGVPASIAAAAAIPAAQQQQQQAAPATPQENAVVISAEPVVPAVEQPAVAAEQPAVAAAALPPVVPEAPKVVVPETPAVVPAVEAPVPATPQGSSAAAVAEPVVPANPTVVAAASNVVEAPIVPVTTVVPTQTSAVPPIVVPTTSVAPTSAPPVTTGTSVMTRTNVMSTASLSVTRSLTSSASASRSASPTITIPPISASNSLQQGASLHPINYYCCLIQSNIRMHEEGSIHADGPQKCSPSAISRTGLSSLKDTGLTIISLYGVSEAKQSSTIADVANTIAGAHVFAARHQLAEGIQFYLDEHSKTIYLFADANMDTTSLSAEKSVSASMMNHQAATTKALLFMLMVSHLVIPILPPSFLPADFLSTLVALAQIKSNMHTHLAQYQSSCWKYWDIAVPNALFEKKDNERMNPALMGWWGPAKGVPIVVFVMADVSLSSMVPATIKKMQDTLQSRMKNVFRALHLIPLKPEGNSSHPPVEVRSLFIVPSTAQPVIHIIPAAASASASAASENMAAFSFDEPPSLASYMASSQEPASTHLDYSDRLLKHFVNTWIKTAISRHPLHNNFNNRKSDTPKVAPLPTGLQLASAMVPVMSFIFSQQITEEGVEFKKAISAQFPGTKGMVQQIEVILRKKIRDNIEIERVFSKSHSIDVMQKCNEAYLQDSPPYYTEKYHTWKKTTVMRMYRSLARGPCMEEYAARLERECDAVWKGGRQSCEHTSLTGRACRLKIGHEKEVISAKQLRDGRTVVTDPSKHNSGYNFFHACDCGRTQRVREDPFDMEDANIKFYNKFSCCLGVGRAALDIKKSTFGDKQDLVLDYDAIPASSDAALLYLGSSSMYKNSVGLDKVEGFMNNTNFLIPWSMTTMHELKLRQQEAAHAVTSGSQDATPPPPPPLPPTKTIHDTFLRSNASSHPQSATRETEWPVLGKATSAQKTSTPAAPVVVASLEAFPALGSNPPTPSSTTPASSAATTPQPPPPTRQLFDTRRRKHHRARDRIQGLIRGYVGAEYECPHGHRFLSCGEGRICKLGHAGHPKEHGNYFVHQDLPLYVICPCTYANNASNSNSSSSGNGTGNASNAHVNANSSTSHANHNMEITAQLQRLYIVTPEEAITISIEPKIKIQIPGTDKHVIVNLDIDCLSFGPDGLYVLRLPFIYSNPNGSPIPVEADVQKRLKSAMLQRDCIKFHYKETEKWIVP